MKEYTVDILTSIEYQFSWVSWLRVNLKFNWSANNKFSTNISDSQGLSDNFKYGKKMVKNTQEFL